jgi:ADP-heptose:LPS heptosyltransferase
VNLQYGDVDAELEDLRQREDLEIMKVRGLDVFNDIEGLVALIDACDVVVTTSSITAHLTGALGKRGCVLVPFSEGRIWYWHLEDKWSFWYPSLRVFYQDRPNDWSNTIFEVANWLEEVK